MPCLLILAMVFLTSVTSGCAEKTDSASEVKDLRILAVAAEPPEVLFDRQTGFDSPQVVFSALVADPQAGTKTYTWRFCPIESDQACADFPAVRTHAPPALQPMLDGLFALQDQGSASSAPEQGVAALTMASFPAAWPTDLFNYHLNASGLGLGNGAWPSVVFSIQDDKGASVVAQKRITLNARDLAQFNPELQTSFKFQVCAPEAPPVGCLALRPRVANKNPSIAAISVGRGRTADLPFEVISEPLVVRAGETIRFRPTLSAEAFEAYQNVESALQNNALKVEEKKERPVISWFATAGEFGNELTAVEITKNFDNTYTAPKVPPATPGGEASLWLVARDLRGGVGWRHLRLVILP